MLPKIIKDAILSVEGIGYAGRIESITWPKLARKMEDFQAGGMNGPIAVDMGSEKLEMEFELAEQAAELIRLWGVCNASAHRFRINASAESDNPGCEGNAIEVIAFGRLREIDFGGFKPAEKSTVKFTADLTALTYKNDGELILDIDHVNSVLVVNGVDLLKKRRENLRM
ncbi:phage major tail tube protein [Histophilus somni]|uniref:phage major tail tube protein n=1 Tax=Histophilus somni TaxID=731 RepID=UPI00201EAC4D|nr:phage major tail tube protein [Histophilus somni]